MRDADGIRVSLSKLKALIASTGASVSPSAVAQALPIYLRAIAEALLSAPQRYGDNASDTLDFEALLAKPDEAPRPMPETAAPGVMAATPAALGGTEGKTKAPRIEPGAPSVDGRVATIRQAGVTPHQLRHFFNNELTQNQVAKEFRADLLGHMGEGETDERY